MTATATLTASQAGFTGAFKASISGCVGVGTPPTVTVVKTGTGKAHIVVKSTGALGLNLGCTVTVTGGQGDKATAPVTITLGVLPTPTPTPTSSPTPNPSASPTVAPSTSPTPAPTLGPISLNPASILLNPGLASSASATVAVTQPGYTGAYKAKVSGCTGVGSPPTAKVVRTGPGTANVILTSTGTVNLNLGCTLTVTGGGGDTATAPVTVTLSVLSTPTPSPSAAPSATASPNPSASPTVAPSASPTAAPTLGPVVLNPSSMLLNPGLGATASENVSVTQSGYTGTYTADAVRAHLRPQNVHPFSVSLTNCVGVGSPPSATITSTGPGTANLEISAVGTLNLNLGCSAVVTGGGGMTATESITITLSVLSSPTPSPSPAPTSSAAIGTLTVNPTSVLLSPGLGSAATAGIAVSQPNFTGTFTANVTGCVGVGSPPVAAVTGTGTGTATVTVTATGVLNANLGCNVVITGGNGQTATVPVTITLSALSSPSPAPSPTGTALGTLTANPSSVLLLPGIGANATTNVVAAQANYTGSFGATLSCPIMLGQQPTVTVASNGIAGEAVVTVTVGGTIAASVACTLTISGGGGQKVSVPVTIGATVGGGATPTPQPSGAPGLLAANPSSVLLNPGVTTSASQNIALTDPGYTGTYGSSITCATSGLPPLLANLFTMPSAAVTGSTLTVTVPGEPLGLSIGCNVVVTTSVPQSLTVPITISVSALQGLKRRIPENGAMLFSPASVTLQPNGTRAAGSFAVAGANGPYTTSVACPAGIAVRTTALGNVVEIEQLTAGTASTCMVTVTSASGVSSQVPVRTYAAESTGIRTTLPGSRRIALGRTSLAVRVGETQSISLTGAGPFTFAGCERVAVIREVGGTILAEGRSAGTCTLTVRGSGGSTASLTLSVGGPVDRLLRPETGGISH
jgi:hypothetical protein